MMSSIYEKQSYLLEHLAYSVLVMAHMQWFTCDVLLAMVTKDNRRIMLYELSLESLGNPENSSENLMRIV